MHEKSVRTLEFPAVLARAAAEAGFSVARERLLALQPATDLDEARGRLSFTSEAVRLLDVRPGTAVGSAHDVRPQLLRASREGSLTAGDLLAVLATLRSAVAVGQTLQDLDAGVYPQLRGLCEALPTH